MRSNNPQLVQRLLDIFPPDANAFWFPNKALVDSQAVANRRLIEPATLVDELDPYSDNYMDGVRGASVYREPFVFTQSTGLRDAKNEKLIPLAPPGVFLEAFWMSFHDTK